MRRVLLKGLAIVLLIVALAVISARVYVRSSLPQLAGTVTVAGISGPVDIIRDRDAVTHVFASTRLDTFYGLGYAHAQDRLWQMEFQRRVGNGRLSEVFGAPTVATDRFLRTLGTGRAARSAWDTLPADAKEAVNRYVAGVNAFIATHHGRELPIEFTALRFEPEPWSGPDVLVWVKMMAWDLSKNYGIEMLRHDLVQLLGAARAAELLRPYPADAPTILTPGDSDPRRSFQDNQADRVIEPDVHPAESAAPTASWVEAFAATPLPGSGDALGSNNWVVDGSLTASGKPLLANDPHLGAQIPSLWYLAHLSAGDFDVIGATLPGAPAIAIGRNRHIAWGETNTMADVQDLFLEHLDPSGTRAEFRGAQEPLRIVRETIVVKGAEPIVLDVRISRHGPLISDAVNANNAASPRVPRAGPIEPLAFRWTALEPEDRTIVAFLGLNQARNWTDFTTALRDVAVPAQNFVYADVDGHIGYYAPGLYPIRASGNGSAHAEGWTGAAEWTGWIPFEALPHAFDPPDHFIVTANQKPVPAGYPYAIGGEWTEPYRATRIVTLLKQKRGFTPDDFAAIQLDTLSLHAQEMLPILFSRIRPKDAREQQAISMLRAWDRDARGDSAAAAIFQAWYYELLPAIVLDELGAVRTASYEELDRTSYAARFLMQTLSTPDSPWCDDIRTSPKETCDGRVLLALHDGLTRLTALLGEDMTRWRWDAVHKAVFAHSSFDTVAVLGGLFRRTAPHGGDWSTVNVGPVFAPKPFEQHSLPGYRQIVDLSPANDSRFLEAVGQSGNVFSPHFDDALGAWSAGQYRKMRMERNDAEQDAVGRLRLVPR
jgi:penicillin G amidase